jgi:hypothetical protein
MRRARQNARARGKAGSPKERKTFTLSRQSISLLHDLRAARRGSRRKSVSAVLDDLLLALDTQRRRDAVAHAITSFYDGISDQARADDRVWGEFSLSQFMDGSG